MIGLKTKHEDIVLRCNVNSMYTYIHLYILFLLVEPEALVGSLAHWGSIGVFLLLQVISDVVWRPWISIAVQIIVSVSPRF